MSEDVYVLGIDMIKFGRFPEKSLAELGAEAALLALDDAGLKIQDVEAMWCGNLMQANNMVGQQVLQQIGQTGIPVVNCANACATGATAFRDAWLAVKAGAYDVVLAVGVEQMGKGLLGGTGAGRGHRLGLSLSGATAYKARLPPVPRLRSRLARAPEFAGASPAWPGAAWWGWYRGALW